MTDPEKQIKEFLQRHRDSPFSAAQLGGSLSAGEPALRVMLDGMVKSGELVRLSGGRYIYTTNADVVSYHLMKEVAPNITFEEFIAHRDEPHILARISRDRDITKDPRGAH